MASPTHAPPGDRSGRHRATKSIEIDRRRFLTYLVSGATLTVATYAGVEALAPSSASAAPIPSGPHPIDFQDVGDILIAAYRPTFNLMRLEVLENGNVRFELPRTDVGTGITTAMAMVIADEMDVPVENVEVPMSDARPELLFNMLTGGSCTLRALIPPVRALAAVARGQLVAAAANMLDVPPGTIRTLDGYAVDDEGRQIAFGDLSSVAAQLDLPLEDVPVKTSAEEIAHARAVLEAGASGVGMVDGAMVDDVHLRMAQALLDRADGRPARTHLRGPAHRSGPLCRPRTLCASP